MRRRRSATSCERMLVAGDALVLGRRLLATCDALSRLSCARGLWTSCAPRQAAADAARRRPRSPTAPRPSSSPPRATTCASRCMRWACSPRRCASAAARAGGGAARQQHQRLGRCARGPVLRAARHHPHRQRRRRGARRSTSSVGELFAQAAAALRADRVREGAARCAFAAARHVVHADPLLVERILRNLVSNAIRYTDDGSVLVSCRRRGGAAAAAGLGHRRRHRRGTSSSASSRSSTRCRRRLGAAADQRKGLGLGLAIVERLADLMGAPLGLRSEPGRGTVFTLELPLGRAAPRRAPALLAQGPGRSDARRAADRRRRGRAGGAPGPRGAAARAGARRCGFDSVAAVRAPGRAEAAAATPPALLIVDYRLEGGRSGIEAIARAALRFGAGVPAIVVTGSTMSDHEAEAQAHALPPADQAGAAEQAAGDDRLQARPGRASAAGPQPGW